MIKRWLIRSLFLLPLVCVVGVWLASYFGVYIIGGFEPGRRSRTFFFQGYVSIDTWPEPLQREWHLIFHYPISGTAKEWLYQPTTLGFRIARLSGEPGSLNIVFPLWLPTLLLLGLNWFVWRKTRAKPPGRAFPVEPVKKDEG